MEQLNGEGGGSIVFYMVAMVLVVGVLELSTFGLWHQRLGHPSKRVVKMLPAICPSHVRKKLNYICNVCPMGKQT